MLQKARSNSSLPRIITGAGQQAKSLLRDTLRGKGYFVSEHIGPRTVRQQAMIAGRGLPWVDPRLFMELLLSSELAAYEAMIGFRAPAFAVGGVPDIIGFALNTGISVPAHLRKAAELLRYNDRVMVTLPCHSAPPQTEAERMEFDEERRLFDATVLAYRQCDYVLVELPDGTAESRVAYMLDSLCG